jgi:hypothetical protein
MPKVAPTRPAAHIVANIRPTEHSKGIPTTRDVLVICRRQVIRCGRMRIYKSAKNVEDGREEIESSTISIAAGYSREPDDLIRHVIVELTTFDT